MLRLATDGGQLHRIRAGLAEARAWGRTEDDISWLDADACQDLVGVRDALGGLWSPHCTTVHPGRLVRGLARAVERRGVRIHEDSRALSVCAGRVACEGGTVRAEVVVLALEAYAVDLPRRRRDRVPLRSTMIATAPLSDEQWSQIGWLRRHTLTDARRELFYAQRTGDRRIAFGGRGAPYRWGSQTEESATQLAASAAGVRQVLTQVFPNLADVEITHRWSGVLGVPRDWTPSVSLDRRTGIGSAGGYSGDGVALAQLAGRTMAHLVTRTASELLELPWVGHQSRAWEPEPLRFLGIRGVERLAAAADRRERATGSAASPAARLFSAVSGH